MVKQQPLRSNHFLRWTLLCLCLVALKQSTGDALQLPPLGAVNYDLVTSICNNQKVKIDSVSMMAEIIFYVQQDHTKICKSRYLSALEELDPILKTRTRDLCSESTFDRVKEYHRRFIELPRRLGARRVSRFDLIPVNKPIFKKQLHPEPSKYTAEFDQHNHIYMTPIAVRHFFLAYVLQLSYTCKRNLANNLPLDSERLLSDDDHDVMLLFDRTTLIGETLATSYKTMNFDNVLYIKELDGPSSDELPLQVLSNNNANANKTIHLQASSSTNSSIYQLVVSCRNKFKPIYDKLIMPLIRLSKLGYDYRGKQLNASETDYLNGPEMEKWLKIVHVCELFRGSIVLDGSSVPETMVRRRHRRGHQPSSFGTRGEGDGVANSEVDGGEVEVEEEETLTPIDELEYLELGRRSRELDIGQPIDYRISMYARLEDSLMIRSTRELDYELSLKPGNKNPFGVRGALRRTVHLLKRGLAKFDIERFVHYRRYSSWYRGILNIIGYCTILTGMTITIIAYASI